MILYKVVDANPHTPRLHTGSGCNGVLYGNEHGSNKFWFQPWPRRKFDKSVLKSVYASTNDKVGSFLLLLLLHFLFTQKMSRRVGGMRLKYRIKKQKRPKYPRPVTKDCESDPDSILFSPFALGTATYMGWTAADTDTVPWSPSWWGLWPTSFKTDFGFTPYFAHQPTFVKQNRAHAFWCGNKVCFSK